MIYNQRINGKVGNGKLGNRKFGNGKVGNHFLVGWVKSATVNWATVIRITENWALCIALVILIFDRPTYGKH